MRAVWTIAVREFLAVVRTKGFWFLSVLAPLFIGIPLYVIWLALLPLLDDAVSELEIDMSDVFEESFETQLDMVRGVIWGDPLKYYVVDTTGQLKDSIRQEIFERDLIHVSHRYGSVSMSREELQGWIDDDPSLTITIPNLSRSRFQEVQDSNVSIETLNTWLGTGKISGYFILPEEILSSNTGAQFVRPSKLNRTQARKSNELKLWFEDIITSVRQTATLRDEYDIEDQPEAQLHALNIDIRRSVPRNLSSSTSADTNKSTNPSRSPLANWVKAVTIPYVYFFIMVMTSATNLVVTNTIEEKSSKVAELLVANSTPTQILDGKLLGNIVVVLLPIVVFCVVIGPPVIGILGTLVGFDSPTFATLFHPSKLFTWFLFLLLGFAFFGYIQGALGSLCNDLKETMLTLYPVQFFNTFGVLPALVFVMFAPDGKFAQILSFIPFFAPSIMVGRAASLPQWPIYLLIVILMVASVIVVRKFSTTLFSHGMLAERAPSRFGTAFRLGFRPA